MSRMLSVTIAVDARFTIQLYDVPDDMPREKIEDLALEQFSLEDTDPLRLADYWHEDVVSIHTPGGEIIYEK